MPTTTANDSVQLSYEATGTGPPDLLFLHGWGGSARYFRETIDELDTTAMRCLSLDGRGHGRSADGDDYSLQRMGRDALAAADDAGAGELVLVGFSMGAKVALQLALEARERVAGLILIAGCPVGEIPLPAELLDEWYGRAGDAERMGGLMTEFASNPIAPAVVERFGQEGARIPRAALEGTMQAVAGTSIAEEVGSIGAPVLVIGGAHDPLFTPDLLRATVVAPLPHARLLVLDAMHEVPAERPRELALAIEGFLAGSGR